MHPLRALIREHCHAAMAVFVLAFFIKAVIPVGFMVSVSSNTVLTVSICSDATNGLKQIQLVVPENDQGSDHSDSAKKDGHCAFSGLAKVSIHGAGAFLLALAFAIILVLGLAPTPRLPFRKFAHLRPPLRGPPATA